jgi:catechol 2,3-dioxygenase-like lactoylglutathione lyase family enzyme
MTQHMRTRTRSIASLTLSMALLASALGTAAHAQSQAAANQSVRPLIWQDSMNVFRRFPVDQRAKMLEFYGKVLALRSLSPINLGGGAQMVLYGVGSGQVKLSAGQPASRQYKSGPVNEVTGLRVITLFFPDEAALVARFRESGYPAPVFRDGHHGTRVAMVQDPAGHMTELVVVPNAPAGSLDRMEVGITVSDLDKSRAFYREFVGLDELPPVQDVLLGVTKYPYRHGQTTVNLWTFGKGLPADTGSAGIQYVVSDVDTVDARAKARQVTVETPLGDMRGFAGLRTVWLNDPDGVTNYFAQTSQSARAR